MGYYYKNRTRCLKNCLQEVVEATGEFIANSIADKIVKAKPISRENLRDVEEVIILPEKEDIVNELSQVL